MKQVPVLNKPEQSYDYTNGLLYSCFPLEKDNDLTFEKT